MAEEFQAKVDSGQARKASGGFSGKGFTFDDSEQSESQQVRHGMTRLGLWSSLFVLPIHYFFRSYLNPF